MIVDQLIILSGEIQIIIDIELQSLANRLLL